MLFKFIWVAITALALYGCPGEDKDEDGNDEDAELTFDGGTATWDNGAKLSITVKEGDDTKEGVDVTFTVKCGDKDAATASVKSSDKGVATTTIAKVAGATDAKELQACKVTAKMGTGDAAEEKVIQAGTAAAADKLMGMVHSGFTWTTTAPSCDKALIYVVAGTDLAASDTIAGVTGTNAKLLVLPIADDTGDCTIGTVAIKADNDNAFDDTSNAAAVNGTGQAACTVTTCFKISGSSLTAWGSASDVTAGEKWIKKTGNKYVYHVVAS